MKCIYVTVFKWLPKGFFPLLYKPARAELPTRRYNPVPNPRLRRDREIFFVDNVQVPYIIIGQDIPF
jgi:hypothetical protein